MQYQGSRGFVSHSPDSIRDSIQKWLISENFCHELLPESCWLLPTQTLVASITKLKFRFIVFQTLSGFFLSWLSGIEGILSRVIKVSRGIIFQTAKARCSIDLFSSPLDTELSLS
jgi:hypothetical protein